MTGADTWKVRSKTDWLATQTEHAPGGWSENLDQHWLNIDSNNRHDGIMARTTISRNEESGNLLSSASIQPLLICS